MKTTPCLAYVALTAATLLCYQNSLAVAQQQKLPPLIDREVFFGDPEIAGGQISPDGRYVSFLKTNAGQINIWVKTRAEPFAAARPLTADSTRPITGYFWSEDGRYVLYVHDKGGDENFHLFAIDPTQAARGKLPVARDLTPLPKVRVMIIALPKSTPNVALIGINDRDPAMHDVYRVDLTTGKRELVFKNEFGLAGYNADVAGNLRLGIKVAADGLGTEVYDVRSDKPQLLFTITCDIFQGCAPIRFHKDGRHIYVTNAQPSDDFTHLALYDLETRQWQKVEEDPQHEVDFGGADFSNATDDLVATYYLADRLRIYPKDAQFAKDLAAVRKALGDGDIYFGSSTNDDRLHLVSVTSDVDPGATYLYDRQTGKVELLYRPRPKLPTQSLAPRKPVRYTARDGLQIPAYLTVPKGLAARELPVVMLPHGGPWGRDTWGYDAFAQFLANRGYAVLQPNFRGSTGYGRKFLDAGNKEWGTGAMQHDISDGVKWLIDERIADPRRVAIMGGSYGGYATLAGVAFTPDLYAAGVSIVGPSSIPTLLASIPPYWAPIKKAFDIRLGDPNNPQDMERLKAQSPLYKAGNIKAPLLVIQGQNDPRVNKAESDQIVVALRDLGRAPAYLVAPDEGHGFARRENRLAMFAAIEKFLAQQIGGRFQPDMPNDIQKRLALLTVNVDTLRLAMKASGNDVELKFDGSALQPATWVYHQQVNAGGRTMEATTTTTVAKTTDNGKSYWLVVDAGDTPRGAAADSVWLDAVSLAPVKRIAHQGSASASVAMQSDSIIGSLQAGPQTMPIRVKATLPVFMNGGALAAAFTTMSMSTGTASVYREFDLMTAAVKAQRVKVGAVEKVTVPAGTFDAYRVEVKPVDGSADNATCWIESGGTHRLLKWQGTLPAQMGGGTILIELVK